MNKLLLIVGLLLVTFTGGCIREYRSYDFTYQADAVRLPSATALEQYTLGVAKFEDKRSWVDIGNPRSESFVSQEGTLYIGMTYNKIDYVPVKDIVQDLLVKELTNAGFKAKALDFVLTKENADRINKVGTGRVGDFVLGGVVSAFEVVNKPGPWISVTSNRKVLLEVELFSGKDVRLILNSNISETENQEYPIGVVPQVSVHNLMNQVFKKAAQQVLKKTVDGILADLH
jgi:hypothetical protein